MLLSTVFSVTFASVVSLKAWAISISTSPDPNAHALLANRSPHGHGQSSSIQVEPANPTHSPIIPIPITIPNPCLDVTKGIAVPAKESAPSTRQFWYEAISHNGEASYMDPSYKPNYRVFRNVVTDFGADNTGQVDASTAIQNAITAGASNGPARDARKMGASGQPAVVYIPSGTYLLEKGLQLYLGTVVMGDPLNPPVLKAGAGFSEGFIVRAKDPNFEGTNNFFVGFKHLVLDSTDVEPGRRVVLLDWSVSQATQLMKVVFNMPADSEHVGLSTYSDANSNLILNDLKFNGGRIGLDLGAQQWVLRNMHFSGTTIGAVAGAFDIVFLGCRWEGGHVGINARPTKGSLILLDSSSTNLDTLIESYDSSTSDNTIILENTRSDGTAVTLDGKNVLTGNVDGTWYHGDLYFSGRSSGKHVKAEKVASQRSLTLLAEDSKYFTMPPPTYEEYPVDSVVNVKSVFQFPVRGDGVTDDTVNINAILATYAGHNIIYFPAGTYIVTGTIIVPPGSRIVGDAFASAISAQGSNFMNEHTPVTMVQVGLPGDVGIAQISDMLFTISDVLNGCKLLEVNMAGNKPGDVGLWNSHIRIGGTKGTSVQTHCTQSPSQCKAAWGLLHLTATSSAYIENLWGWTADHDLDGTNNQTISTARGALIEARKGTWLVGTGLEHNTLYQYNFNDASNVFTALQQSETPYWQGEGSDSLAPAPWSSSLIPSDPNFTNCDHSDAKCRMAWFQQIRDSTELFLYGAGTWTFFNDNGGCYGGLCQKNAIRIQNSRNVYFYGTNTRSIDNMFLDADEVVVTAAEHAGGWGGVVAGIEFG